ncbi:hypothetical protein D3C87_1868530 [compost metagenome]
MYGTMLSSDNPATFLSGLMSAISESETVFSKSLAVEVKKAGLRIPLSSSLQTINVLLLIEGCICFHDLI